MSSLTMFTRSPLPVHVNPAYGNPNPPVSAAAAAPSRALTQPVECEYVSLPDPLPVSAASLTAVPSGMVRTMQARGKKQKRKTSVARFFNDVAGRPYPRLTSMQQSIQVALQGNIPGWATSSTTNPVYASKSFSTADVTVGSFLGVFDQYRIDQIEVWLEPDTQNLPFGIAASCVDLDDAVTPSTFSSVADHQQALVGGGGAGRYHKWKPHMAVAAFSGAFTSYANEPAGWIDSNSPNVQHYGFKAAFKPNANAINYGLSYRLLMSFRAPGIN